MPGSNQLLHNNAYSPKRTCVRDKAATIIFPENINACLSHNSRSGLRAALTRETELNTNPGTFIKNVVPSHSGIFKIMKGRSKFPATHCNEQTNVPKLVGTFCSKRAAESSEIECRLHVNVPIHVLAHIIFGSCRGRVVSSRVEH